MLSGICSKSRSIETTVIAVVRFANNLFKFVLFGRQVDWDVSLRSGLPAWWQASPGLGRGEGIVIALPEKTDP